MVDARKEAIKGAIERGHSIDVINQGLAMNNWKPLSSYEEELISRGRYDMNFAQRFTQGAIDFGKGLSTLGGGIYQYRNNPAFRDYVNDNVGKYLYDTVHLQANPVYDFVKLMMAPSGLTPYKVLHQSPIETGKQIVEYAAADPFNFTLDALPVYGAVTKVAPGLKVSNLLSKATSKVPAVDQLRSAIMPTDYERMVNTILNTQNPQLARQAVKATKDIETLKLDKDLEQAVKDLTLGTNLGGKATERLKDISVRLNQDMVDLGLQAGKARTTAVTQYILEKIDPLRKNRVYVQNIEDALFNPTRENIAKLGINQDELFSLSKEANDLFDTGKIFPVTQRGTRLAGDANAVDYSAKGEGLLANRIFGAATPEQVAKDVDRGLTQLFNEIQSAKYAESNLNEMVNKLGRGITPDEIGKIGKGEVVISPTEFKEGVRTLFNTGKQSELGDLIKGLNRDMPKSSINKYANDLYVLNKKDLGALANRYSGYAKNTATGKIISASKPIMGAFKSAVLTKFPYIAGNRIGNFSLGLIGGADYATALTPNMIREFIPDTLRRTTSFHGMAPQFESQSLSNTFANINKNISREADILNDANATFGQKLGALGNIINETQGYVTRPLFQTESSFELVDRAAVYFNEAKKLAKELNEPFETILKRAKTDKDLQSNLINKVNNVLGDYVGRNYYINPNAYELGTLAFPFHKILTTSKDVLINQAIQHPLRLQAFARVPSRIGNRLGEIDVELGRQPSDNDVRGGLVNKPTYSRYYPAQKVFNDYHPLIAPIETLASVFNPNPTRPEEQGLAGAMDLISGNLSPLGGLMNALRGEDRYGNEVVAPNVIKVNGKYVAIDNNGNRIVQPERNILGTTANYLANNFLGTVTLANQTLLPAIGAITGREYFNPTSSAIFGQFEGQDTIPILSEGKVNQLGTKNLREWMDKQLGFKTREVYFPYHNEIGTQRDFSMAQKKAARQKWLRYNRRYR